MPWIKDPKIVPMPAPAPAIPIVAIPAPMACAAANIVKEERWRSKDGEDTELWTEGARGRLRAQEGFWGAMGD